VLDSTLYINGRALQVAGIAPAGFLGTDAGYFEAVATRLVAGRAFRESDRTGPLVTVINQALADRLWPGEAPVGRDVRINGEVYTVAGVTRTGRYQTLIEPDRAYAFLPLRDQLRTSRMIYVKGRSSAPQALETLRQAVAALDPDIALEQAVPLADAVRVFTVAQRIAATMIGFFGLAGLLLAAIGIYGIVAYQVAQRSREFGIRRALGATGADVVRLVLRHGLTLSLIGGLAGIILSIAGSRLTTGFLGSLAPPDVMPFIAFPLILGATSLLASWLPARRAAKVDPMRAMRTE
jgi:putative ABC transport system permease protein